MKTVFDQQSVDITCPDCGHKFPQKIGRLKNSPQVNCVVCGKLFQIDAEQFRKDIETIQKGVNGILSTFKNIR